MPRSPAGAVAVPGEVRNGTVTVFPLAAESVTVIVASTVPVFPSTTVALLIDAIDSSLSSSLIVVVAVAVAIVALVAPESVTVKVSLFSSSVSSTDLPRRTSSRSCRRAPT